MDGRSNPHHIPATKFKTSMVDIKIIFDNLLLFFRFRIRDVVNKVGIIIAKYIGNKSLI
jgi:hypothetical protein